LPAEGDSTILAGLGVVAELGAQQQTNENLCQLPPECCPTATEIKTQVTKDGIGVLDGKCQLGAKFEHEVKLCFPPQCNDGQPCPKVDIKVIQLCKDRLLLQTMLFSKQIPRPPRKCVTRCFWVEDEKWLIDSSPGSRLYPLHSSEAL